MSITLQYLVYSYAALLFFGAYAVVFQAIFELRRRHRSISVGPPPGISLFPLGTVGWLFIQYMVLPVVLGIALLLAVVSLVGA
jgi:hypothetical protein